jgi:hypothetical protein
MSSPYSDAAQEPDQELHPHLKSVVLEIMETFEECAFQRRRSLYQKGQLPEHVAKKSWSGPPSEVRPMRFALHPAPSSHLVFIAEDPVETDL